MIITHPPFEQTTLIIPNDDCQWSVVSELEGGHSPFTCKNNTEFHRQQVETQSDIMEIENGEDRISRTLDVGSLADMSELTFVESKNMKNSPGRFGRLLGKRMATESRHDSSTSMHEHSESKNSARDVGSSNNQDSAHISNSNSFQSILKNKKKGGQCSVKNQKESLKNDNVHSTPVGAEKKQPTVTVSLMKTKKARPSITNLWKPKEKKKVAVSATPCDTTSSQQHQVEVSVKSEASSNSGPYIAEPTLYFEETSQVPKSGNGRDISQNLRSYGGNRQNQNLDSVVKRGEVDTKTAALRTPQNSFHRSTGSAAETMPGADDGPASSVASWLLGMISDIILGEQVQCFHCRESVFKEDAYRTQCLLYADRKCRDQFFHHGCDAERTEQELRMESVLDEFKTLCESLRANKKRKKNVLKRRQDDHQGPKKSYNLVVKMSKLFHHPNNKSGPVQAR